MGGDNDPLNLTPPISVELHAALHKDLYETLGKTEDFIAWKMLSGQSLKGIEMTDKIKEKISKKLTGIKRSDETKEKDRQVQLNRDPEINIKISNSLMGHTVSKKTKLKISKATKKRLSNPENHPLFGKHHTKDSNEKNRISHMGKIPWNKGLKNPQIVTEDTKRKLSEASKKVWERRRINIL